MRDRLLTWFFLGAIGGVGWGLGFPSLLLIGVCVALARDTT